jgi:hypothetical protein
MSEHFPFRPIDLATLGDDPGAALTGVTPGGLPYPESSEAVAGGANAIKALALALDPSFIEVSSTGIVGTPSGSWTQVPLTTIGAQSGAMTLVANAVQVAEAGRYLVVVNIAFAANSTGRRGAGCSLTGVSGGVIAGQQILMQAPPAAAQVMVTFAKSVAAGTAFTIWSYQDSGAAVSLSTSGLTVTKL